MDWITPQMLKTVSGAALAVTLITGILKAIMPSIAGRITQIVALVIALLIAGITGTWTTPATALVSILNAGIIWVSAMGLDQVVNYKKPVSDTAPRG